MPGHRRCRRHENIKILMSSAVTSSDTDKHTCRALRKHAAIHAHARTHAARSRALRVGCGVEGDRVAGWLEGRESMLGWPRAINRRLSRPSAASLIYGAPPIAPGFIWPLSNTRSVGARSPALAAPLCILNHPDGNCPFPKC